MIEKVSKLRGRSQLKLVFIKKLITSIAVKIITRIAARVIDIGLLFRQKYYMRKLVDGGAPLKAGRQSLKQ